MRSRKKKKREPYPRIGSRVRGTDKYDNEHSSAGHLAPLRAVSEEEKLREVNLPRYVPQREQRSSEDGKRGAQMPEDATAEYPP